MKTVIKMSNGGVAIMTLIGNANETEAVNKWKSVNPDLYVSHRQMPDDSIPADRTLRHLWSDTTLTPVIDIAPESNSRLAAEARDRRNDLLTATDWAASSDVTMSAAMTSYRQALRDITDQQGFPTNIIWPTRS